MQPCLRTAAALVLFAVTHSLAHDDRPSAAVCGCDQADDDMSLMQTSKVVRAGRRGDVERRLVGEGGNRRHVFHITAREVSNATLSKEAPPVLDKSFTAHTSDLSKHFILLNPHLAISVCLLFAITFFMCVVNLANWHEDEMRYYAYLLVTTTISIFLAVLMFQAVNTLLEVMFATHSKWVMAAREFTQMICYYLLMQFLTAWCSGSLTLCSAHGCCTFEPDPFEDSVTEWRRNHKEEPLSQEELDIWCDIFKRNTRCWTMLFAHATGFAAMCCGGSIQQVWVQEHSNPVWSYVVVAGMYLALIILFWACRFLRLSLFPPYREHRSRSARLTAPPAEADCNRKLTVLELSQGKGKQWCFELWDEEAYDGEEDAAGICVSFLFVQALRLNISGRLPDNFGIEDTHFDHNVSATVQLLVSAVLLISLLVVMLICKSYIPEQSGTSHKWRLAQRFANVAQSGLAMAFAWCLLYAVQYEETKLLPKEAPWTITERMILAFGLSVAAFMFIYILEKLEANGGHGRGSTIGEVYYKVIMAMSLLVGFSWEQCFDRAVEVVGLVTPHPEIVKVVLAIVIFIIVVVPFRRNIISELLKLEVVKLDNLRKYKDDDEDDKSGGCLRTEPA